MTASSLPIDDSPVSSLAADTRYAAALDWLMGRINYERTARIPYHERQLKLDRMRQLLTRLGSPDAGMKIVHVAGTKGKGSTAAIIAEILLAAGYRTGVFSSPHLERIEERFVIDGQVCSSDDFVSLVERLRPVAELLDLEAAAANTQTTGPTYFEITTAMALQHFADRQVDAAVLEVGLGGRLDSTNVCLPLVSVITSISRDHTKQLGSSQTSIAHEKAGIIKPGVPVVSGVTQSGPRVVIAKVAKEHGCRLIQLGRDFKFHYTPPKIRPARASDELDIGLGTIDLEYSVDDDRNGLEGAQLAMLGSHQAANAAIATAVTAELRHQGWSISPDSVRIGLARARLPARVELIPGSPPVVVDTAHNAASARALVTTLTECFAALVPRVLVVSISKDKDVQDIVRILVPHFQRFVVTQFQNNPRALPAEQLATCVRAELEKSARNDSPVEVYHQPVAAWHHASSSITGRHLVAITGSFFIAAEMRRLVLAARGSSTFVTDVQAAGK